MLDMLLPRKVVAGFVALSFAGLGACGASGSDLENEVVAALKANPRMIDLGNEVGGSWDRLCVARPYTSQDGLDELLEIQWHRGAAATGIRSLDSATLLVFTDSDQVFGYAMVPRGEGDFSAAAENYCLPRGEAVFQVRVRPDGWRQVLPYRKS